MQYNVMNSFQERASEDRWLDELIRCRKKLESLQQDAERIESSSELPASFWLRQAEEHIDKTMGYMAHSMDFVKKF